MSASPCSGHAEKTPKSELREEPKGESSIFNFTLGRFLSDDGDDSSQFLPREEDVMKYFTISSNVMNVIYCLHFAAALTY